MTTMTGNWRSRIGCRFQSERAVANIGTRRKPHQGETSARHHAASTGRAQKTLPLSAAAAVNVKEPAMGVVPLTALKVPGTMVVSWAICWRATRRALLSTR